nr:hypothetical protein P5626_12470 [Bacillus subtilis]
MVQNHIMQMVALLAMEAAD